MGDVDHESENPPPDHSALYMIWSNFKAKKYFIEENIFV